MLRSRLRLVLLALLLLGVAGSSGCPDPGVQLLALALDERVRTWERFETLGYLWPVVANPFDPAQVDLRGEFLAPDGTLHSIPGFVTQLFERRLVGGFEKLAPRALRHWRVRFAPTAAGEWQWRWVASLPQGSATTDWRSFTVLPPAPDRHGFLRVSSSDPRYLRFDDGAPYVAIGENLAWYDGRGSFAYDVWLARLAEQGANYARLWMPSWAFGLEWIRRDAEGRVRESTLGDYGGRLDRAWQLDRVLEECERRGIYVMLSLQNHGAFSLTANSEWDDNPYNAANGGPLAAPRDLFADATARELFRRRLRYVVARWGASTHVLAWELWNEIDLVAEQTAPDVVAWHREMADLLRALDPYDHLVTTSTALGNTALLSASAGLDLDQIHFYSWQGDFGIPIGPDFSQSLPILLRQAPGTRPVLLAEVGVDGHGPAETLANDPEGVGFHDALWAGLLGRGFGTGMSWWWDNVIDPADLYFHFGPLARFVRDVAFDREGFAPGGASAAAPGRSLRALALRGATVTLVWVKNVAHQWHPPETGLDPTPVEGATLALSGVPDGAHLARWIDTYTGEDLALVSVEAAEGAATLAVPRFARDLALRLERAPETTLR